MVPFPDGNDPGRVPGLFDGGRLSPTQRRVARYVADHPREAPFLSRAELGAAGPGGCPGRLGGGSLSPTQRRVARYVADHPREAPFLSSVELAARAGGGEAAGGRGGRRRGG